MNITLPSKPSQPPVLLKDVPPGTPFKVGGEVYIAIKEDIQAKLQWIRIIRLRDGSISSEACTYQVNPAEDHMLTIGKWKF